MTQASGSDVGFRSDGDGVSRKPRRANRRRRVGGVAKKTRRVKRFTHPKDLPGWSVWLHDPDQDMKVIDLTDQFVSDEPGTSMPEMPAKEMMRSVMTMLEGKAGVSYYLYTEDEELVTDLDFFPRKNSKLKEESVDGKYIRHDIDEFSEDADGCDEREYVFTWRVSAALDPTNSGKSRRCYWYGLRNVVTGREFTLCKGPKNGMVQELVQLHTIVGPKIAFSTFNEL